MKLKFPKQQLIKLLLLVILLTILPVLFISDAYLNQKVVIRRSIKPCNALDPSKRQFRVTLDGVTYPNIVPLYHNSSLDFKCLNSSSSVKTILMWNKFKGLPLINFGFGVRQPFEKMNCPVTNCELTNDRSRLSDADLVIFHLRNKIDYFPTREKVNQRFVQVAYESPVNCHLCAEYDEMFNFTASYRSESDFASIYWTDSQLYWSENEDKNEEIDVFSTKSNPNKFAALSVSNCHSRSGREQLIKELKRYIPIDIFGSCGPFKCPNEPIVKNATFTDTKCREYIANEYKFYLAFENSLCQGYITEKFFDTLKYSIIPVVFGLGNYEFYIPKSGYINALDFKSPKDLADYLVYLDRNKTAYNSYFTWKKYLKKDSRNLIGGGYLCEMCIKLHLEENLGYIEFKELNDLKNLYGLYETCKDIDFNEVKYFNVTNLTRNIYSYFMNVE